MYTYGVNRNKVNFKKAMRELLDKINELEEKNERK
jgi:hypothetical protein